MTSSKVDVFNQPIRNERNRKLSAEQLAAAHNQSVNEQIVRDLHRADADDAKHRVVLPDLTATDADTVARDAAASGKMWSRMKLSVDRYGLKIAHDETFNAVLRFVYDAQRVVDNGALFCATHLERLFTTDDILGLPIGGTDEDDVKGTNQLPDKVSKQYYDRVEAKKRTKVTSFYRELAEQMDEGAMWAARLENFRFASKKQFDKIRPVTNDAAYPDATSYRRGKASDYEKEQNVCSDALSKFAKWLRQGASFIKQMAAAKASKNIRVTAKKDDDGNYSQYKKPITLVDWTGGSPNDENWETLSITSFLNIDIDAAIENGDTWESWQNAMSPETDDEDEDGDGSAVKSVVDVETALAAIANWIDATAGKEKRALAHNQILTQVSKKGMDDFCLSIFDVWTVLDGIVPHIHQRVLKLRAAEAGAREQEATMNKSEQAAASAAETAAAAATNLAKVQ